MRDIDLNGPLDQAVKLLTDAGLRATTDPAEVNAPAVLVGVDQFEPGTLARWTLTAQVALIVPDNGATRVKAALAVLFNQVTDLGITPDGAVLARMFALPEGPPLPALIFPLNLEA